MRNENVKESEYIPVPSNPIPEYLVKCDDTTRGIVKVKVLFELAKFSRLEILGMQV